MAQTPGAHIVTVVSPAPIISSSVRCSSDGSDCPPLAPLGEFQPEECTPVGQDAGMTPEPIAFAQNWAEEWNSHNLDRVLAHYASDVVFRSSRAAQVLPDSDGVVRGIEELRQYWSAALALVPDLHFEVLEVYAGIDTLVIRFRNQLGKVRCEVLTFRDDLIVSGEGTDLAERTLAQ